MRERRGGCVGELRSVWVGRGGRTHGSSGQNKWGEDPRFLQPDIEEDPRALIGIRHRGGPTGG